MRRFVMFLLLALPVAGCLEPHPTEALPHGEYRAVWVTRFEWTSTDPDECREQIRETIKSTADHNFNAVVFQIRGAAETLYPSELEPWSPLLGEQDPGFDPVALAIEEAHRRGLEFHAYINPMPLRSKRWKDPPSDPEHLYYRHGPESAEPWIVQDAAGETSRSEYYYLSAGIPDVHVYLRQVILDVVRRYDVDGIHLDRIRYPGPEFSYDPISRRRFAGRGNPNRLEWPDWQREQLDKLINDLAAEIRAEKPGVVLSCAAWGIYNRYHLDGYYGYSSGFHDYYQDTWNWCAIGAMDVLMPMIYWDIPDPVPNYDTLLDDFIRGVGSDHVVGGQRIFDPVENIAEIEYGRNVDAAGSALFSYRGAMRSGLLDQCKATIYKNKAPTPPLARCMAPRTGTIVGRVRNDRGEPLVDAWVSLAPVDGETGGCPAFHKTWTSGADGRFAFLDVPPGEVTVTVRYPGTSVVSVGPIAIAAGKAATVDVSVPGSVAAAEEPFFLQILHPRDGYVETTAATLHLLGRTSPDCTARVNETPVEVYATGAFVMDNIGLAMGENQVVVVATGPDGETVTRVVTAIRKPPPAPARPTDIAVVRPSEHLAVLPGQEIAVEVHGPAGMTGHVTLLGTSCECPLTERLDGEGNGTGTYTAVIVPSGPTSSPAPVRARLSEKGAWFAREAETEARVEVWDPQRIRVGETTQDQAGITFGTHDVRLGGPYLAEVPAGTRFRLVGRRGDKVRIRLADSLTGWIASDPVKELPIGTPPPRNHFTSCVIGGDEQYDRVSVSLAAPVIVSVTAATEPTNRLYVDFFDTHFATTWISHQAGARRIGTVTGSQIADGWYRLTVPVKSKQLWGYWTERDGRSWTLYVRRPPSIAEPPASPLAGLRIALEAGHGGESSGAVGKMGTKEKTINRNAVDALRRVLEERGATTILVRPGDSGPSLAQRVERANDAGADFYVSVHANAAGSAGGFLRVSGTSTYYHGEHCRRAAQRVYDALLKLGWDEFGVVGNFSYYPLRRTRTPAILIEQAFVSNPKDEARLLDPKYQQSQAVAVTDALEAFFDEVRE